MTPTAPSRLARLTRAALPVAPLALGAIPSAHAVIVYTNPTDLTITAGSSICVDMGGSGLGGAMTLSPNASGTTTDFVVYFQSNNPFIPQAGGYQGGFQIRSETVVFSPEITRSDMATRFTSFATIAGGTLGNNPLLNFNGDSNSTWLAGTTGFLGVRFTAGTNGTVDGWIQVSYNSDLSLTVYDFAYESSGGSIVTPSAVPEPSTYAMMAGLLAGSAALYRRRQKAKAA